MGSSRGNKDEKELFSFFIIRDCLSKIFLQTRQSNSRAHSYQTWFRSVLRKNRRPAKMIVLKEYKFLQKLIGLNPQGGFENIVVRFVYLIVVSSSILMFLGFFIMNIHDNANEALVTLPTILGFSVLLANYLHLLINRKSFCLLLDELQDIVNESTKLKSIKYNVNAYDFFPFFAGLKKGENERIYVKADQRNSFATKAIIYGSIPVPFGSLSPFVLAARNWYSGIYTIDSWVFYYPVW